MGQSECCCGGNCSYYAIRVVTYGCATTPVGASVTVFGPGGFTASCTTTATTFEATEFACTIDVSTGGPGTYTVTATVGGYSRTTTVTIATCGAVAVQIICISDPPCQICITVLGDCGVRVSGATVSLPGVGSCTTGASGRCCFDTTSLMSATYPVTGTITASGYATETFQVGASCPAQNFVVSIAKLKGCIIVGGCCPVYTYDSNGFPNGFANPLTGATITPSDATGPGGAPATPCGPGGSSSTSPSCIACTDPSVQSTCFKISKPRFYDGRVCIQDSCNSLYTVQLSPLPGYVCTPTCPDPIKQVLIYTDVNGSQSATAVQGNSTCDWSWTVCMQGPAFTACGGGPVPNVYYLVTLRLSGGQWLVNNSWYSQFCKTTGSSPTCYSEWFSYQSPNFCSRPPSSISYYAYPSSNGPQLKTSLPCSPLSITGTWGAQSIPTYNSCTGNNDLYSNSPCAGGYTWSE